MARRVKQEPENIDALIKEFELKLERLRVLYEQYFMGIQKRQPSIPQHEVVRLQFKIDKQRINNHRTRYKYRSLVQRLNTYRTYWNRTLRAIENGTYHRDLARLRRKWRREGIDVQMPTSGRLRSVNEVEKAIGDAVKRKEATAQDGGAAPAGASAAPAKKRRAVPDNIRGASADDIKRESDRHVPGQVERPAAAAPQAAAQGQDPSGLPDAQMKSIFRRYLKAKRMVGEDPSSVRYDSLAKKISGQLPQLRQMNNGRDVDFDVVIRKGKVVLKAKPR